MAFSGLREGTRIPDADKLVEMGANLAMQGHVVGDIRIASSFKRSLGGWFGDSIYFVDLEEYPAKHPSSAGDQHW